MTSEHDLKMAAAAYHSWRSRPADGYIDDETLARLRAYHGQDTELFECEGCGDGVYVASGRYREQTKSFVRWGPLFACGECIARELGLTEPPRMTELAEGAER